ncbi:hypothetical protein JXA88_07885 [Candidatus Fermentibacteria bacterium]|nr:hypothetical protein [Candidatus Fermentibacteria bacterium]
MMPLLERSTSRAGGLFLVCTMVLATTSVAGVPTVNGLFFGDGDQYNYHFVGSASNGRGDLYYYLDQDTLYLAVVVDEAVNDNVFGQRLPGQAEADETYFESAGWMIGAGHQAEDLIGSDHLEFGVSCGGLSWDWFQDYLYTNDTPVTPSAAWLSDPFGPDGAGIPPPGLIMSASSIQWSLLNTTWDVTLGGTRDSTDTDGWKSPDDWFDPITGASGDSSVWNNGYPTFDPVWNWEWPMVYEMAISLSACGCAEYPLVVTVWSAHNSPVKDGGDENVPIPPITMADYGDAPAPYPTLLGGGGARHLLVPGGVRLGAIVDAETDGQSSALASGDDIDDGTDDEDGAVFTSPINPGSLSTVDIVASGEGLLNAWMDFNNNGDWADEGEQIFVDQPLVPGVNQLSFSVPASAQTGIINARFRFSTAGGLSFTGEAPDGEVEDYQITVTVAIELGSFSATVRDGGVLLTWSTHSEHENLGFRLFRSEDPEDFLAITRDLIPGAGTTLSPRHYSLVDEDVVPGRTYYYLLSDISFDGVETSHGPIQVSVPMPSATLTLGAPSPSPISGDAQVSLSLPIQGRVHMAIYDLSGRERAVLRDEIMATGTHTIELSRDADALRSIGAGAYVLRVRTAAGTAARSIVIAD